MTSLVRYIAVLLLVAGVLTAQAPAIAGMMRLWNESPMYSYGPLVPLISLFIVWSFRDRLARLTPAPALASGVAVLVAWFVMLVVGQFAGIILIEQLALPVALTGVILVVWGWTFLRTIWAAIAYLLLMVPLWDGFTEPLHLPFQNLSAAIGIQTLQAVGIPAHREGTFIELPNLTLEVARACSGVNYLVAVLALGLPLAYLYLRSPWRRVVLVVTAMLIAALSNSLRVALIGVLAYLNVGSPLHGPGHVLHGLFVAGIGHVVLFVGLWILSRGERRPPARLPATSDAPIRRAWSPATVAAVAVMFWAAAAFLQWYTPGPVPPATPLDRVPSQLGSWTADIVFVSNGPDWWQAADHQLQRRYRVDGSQAVHVLVAYFEAQRQRKEVVPHQAATFHRAAQPFSLSMPEGQPPVTVNLVREGTGDERRLALFWYDIDGVVETSRYGAKMRTLWHALARRRTNAAIVLLTTEVGRDSETPRLQMMADLARQLHHALGETLPGRSMSRTIAADLEARPADQSPPRLRRSSRAPLE